MSSLLSFGMSTSKKEKHHANSRARRHSGDSGKKKKKKDKDTDSESVVSSSTSDTIVVPPPKQCPFRFMLAGMMEVRTEEKAQGCPLRRVQLWHVIPLCLLAIINLLLVIVALVGLAGYRIAMGLQALAVRIAKEELDVKTVAEDAKDADGKAISASETI